MGGHLALWSPAGDHSQATQLTADSANSERGALSPARVKRLLVLADTAAMALGLVTAVAVHELMRPVPASTLYSNLWLVSASLPAFAMGAAINNLYKARANERLSEEMLNVMRAVAVGVATMVALAFAVDYQSLSRLWVLLLATTITTAVAGERLYARRVFAGLRERGRISRRIVIVGTDAHAINMLHTYQRDASLGYEVVGFVGDDDIGSRGGVKVLGPISELGRVLAEQNAVGVVVSLASVGQDEVNALTRTLTDAGYHVALSSILRDIDISRLRPQQLDGRTLLYVEPVIRNGWRAAAKRCFDIVGACGVLLVTAPVWLLAMLAIKLDSKGPVFFRQTRVGKNGEPFMMMKLRTMVVDAEQRKAELLELNEADGPLFKITNDPRVTRVGRILRKLSIDELPQLISVIRGTMSLVGPRPALPAEVDEWDDGLRDRLRVLPGLTGMWQVSGRSTAGFDQYRRLDLYYVDNWSLLHDLQICVRTVGVVLSGRGAA
jgi:exopolysaccharide biosynthesis polyprenyl glycosylphosphotransferase